MMNYKFAGAIALVLALVLLSSWEFYWRSQGRYPDIDDSKELWAVQRSKVDKLDSQDVVLIGSSRVLFDIQLDEWREAYGRKPLQLAVPGSTPLPIFRDLVENTDFNGIMIIGVAPGLFFRGVDPEWWSWKRASSKVEHYENRTLANRLNHYLSIPFQENFVFVASSEAEWDDDIDLRTLIKNVQIGDREGDGHGNPFYRFEDIRLDRNVEMKARMETDTAFAATIQRVWVEAVSGSKSGPKTCEVIDYMRPLLDKFKARGGTPIFVRCPSNGFFLEREKKNLHRDSTWDVLLLETGTPGIHFEDYEALQGLDLPEWSHLSAPDARYFTKEVVSILKEEGLLPNLKSE